MHCILSDKTIKLYQSAKKRIGRAKKGTYKIVFYCKYCFSY